MWRQVRDGFIKALAEQRFDMWLVEESKNTRELGTKYRQLSDISAFSDWLDQKVAEEESGNQNNGAVFASFTGGC